MPLPRGLYSKRGWYYFQPPQRDGFRPPAIALRTRDLSAALTAWRELHAAGATVTESIPLSVALDRYLAHCRASGRHSSLLTGRTYRPAVADLLAITGDCPAGSVTAAQVEKLRCEYSTGHLAASTASQRMKQLRGFFRWLRSTGTISRDPFASIAIPSATASRSSRFVSREIRDLLITQAPTETLRTVLVLGFHAGLRIREIVEARPDWLTIGPTSGTIRIAATATFTPKNRRPRTVPLNSTARAHLATVATNHPFLVAPHKTHTAHPDLSYRFCPYKAFRSHAARCGVPWLSFHNMRHTFGALHAQAGTSIYKIARWLGDSVPVAIHHYAALSPSDSDIERTA